jgi:16S rRNA (adenine(1408)-N(1))-methyltransferase
VLSRARAEPATLVLGIDANAAGMAASASRAARKPRRGGLVNARFVVCAVEALPPALARSADLVIIQLPWAALLRGLVRGDHAVIAPIAGLVRPGGDLRLLLSVTERDAGSDIGSLDERAIESLTETFAALGLQNLERRPATPADVAASGSTWARKLGIARGDRAAWWLRFRATRR